MNAPTMRLGYDEDIALFGCGAVMRAVTSDVVPRRDAGSFDDLGSEDDLAARDGLDAVIRRSR
ncbi:hypothetical protein KIH74_32075 [Kineosporia sp. J2-2]|uniref:Uncharacterized protein n=1 Tax=Kineosporia corallincola TaxID=2835133 RepID=A0ABS5TS40_9ACTN|nr:hypothetical protein [Kineosporia corallincola]MBT0773626.1 hypothetical protein [Kineosporia corallincola]